MWGEGAEVTWRARRGENNVTSELRRGKRTESIFNEIN